MLPASDFPYLPIGDGNHLVRTDSKSRRSKGMDNEDDYYDEVTPDGQVVAKYHTWHHMSIYPPHGVKEGWVKYDIDEKKIASGSCEDIA